MCLKHRCVIINETLARRYFRMDRSANAWDGGRLRDNLVSNLRRLSEIVGTRYQKLNLSAEISRNLCAAGNTDANPELIVRSDMPLASTMSVIRSEIKHLNPNMPAPGIQTMDSMLADVVAQPRFQTTLLTLFGIVALLLSAIGIYGVMAYSVSQRAHEIGIRIALGADSKAVIKLVVGRGMRLVVVGMVIGLAGAFALTRLMSGLLYGVSPTDPLTFAGIPILPQDGSGSLFAPVAEQMVDPMLAPDRVIPLSANFRPRCALRPWVLVVIETTSSPPLAVLIGFLRFSCGITRSRRVLITVNVNLSTCLHHGECSSNFLSQDSHQCERATLGIDR
jgi:predicted lysophospholipase L1 biosynthesis ABC-type transport system permease subunit